MSFRHMSHVLCRSRRYIPFCNLQNAYICRKCKKELNYSDMYMTLYCEECHFCLICANNLTENHYCSKCYPICSCNRPMTITNNLDYYCEFCKCKICNSEMLYNKKTKKVYCIICN